VSAIPAGRIPVAVLGATGVVGQRFVRRLARHPRFEIRYLAASERSAGRPYRDACAWRLPGEPWAGLGDLEVVETSFDAAAAPVVFSALDAATAREVEPAFARAGSALFSNASAFRMDEDVPLVVPEVNPDALGLLERQRRERGWPGAIVCNPNCTAAVLVTALAPLHRAFGIDALLIATMQAASGAGLPGVPSLDLLGNVIPYIRGEEEKVAEEVGKLLGRVAGGRVELATFPVSAACHRVPVVDGHTEAVSLRLRGNPPLELVREALDSFRGEPQRLGLPSAPERPIVVHDAPDRPQPRLDVEAGEGMTVHVGRLRPCPVLGLKLTVLGSNVERGAAGASVLNAELALALGWIGSV
jgi:aspartate-semialdehyde dehydrogenase